MTHAYSASGSRRTAAFAAIIGLHFGIFIAIALGLVPREWPQPARDAGPINILPVPRPPDPVVGPHNPGPIEGFTLTVEQPIVSIARFDEAEERAVAPVVDPIAPGSSGLTGTVEYLPASLRTRDRRMAALIASCYPAASRRLGEEGRAVASISLSAQATVTSWRVHETSGFPRLDAAINCVVKRLDFVPARRDGRSVQAEVLLPIIFRLDGS
ncbi:MAG: energy transducer TonB [Gammaproteobacteria bacterium]